MQMGNNSNGNNGGDNPNDLNGAIVHAFIEMQSTRDRLYDELTDLMLDSIKPTALAGIRDGMSLQDDQITWTDVRVSGAAMTVSLELSITAEEANGIGAQRIIKAMLDDDENLNFPIVQTLSIDLPVRIAFNTKEEITDFVIDQLYGRGDTKLDVDLVDPSELTKVDVEDSIEAMWDRELMDWNAQGRPEFSFDLRDLSREQKNSFLFQQHYSQGKLH